MVACDSGGEEESDDDVDSEDESVVSEDDSDAEAEDDSEEEGRLPHCLLGNLANGTNCCCPCMALTHWLEYCLSQEQQNALNGTPGAWGCAGLANFLGYMGMGL